MTRLPFITQSTTLHPVHKLERHDAVCAIGVVMRHKVVMYVMRTFGERLRLDELADLLPGNYSSAWCAYEWLFDAIESQLQKREIRIWVDVNGDWK